MKDKLRKTLGTLRRRMRKIMRNTRRRSLPKGGAGEEGEDKGEDEEKVEGEDEEKVEGEDVKKKIEKVKKELEEVKNELEAAKEKQLKAKIRIEHFEIRIEEASAAKKAAKEKCSKKTFLY